MIKLINVGEFLSLVLYSLWDDVRLVDLLDFRHVLFELCRAERSVEFIFLG